MLPARTHTHSLLGEGDDQPPSALSPRGSITYDAIMPAETTATEKKKTDKQEGSVKETIESILIAFVLAFVFRAFVVEAFVIPTGSMGPTLMGRTCGLPATTAGIRLPSTIRLTTTPISRRMPIPELFNPPSPAQTAATASRPGLQRPEPVYYGDRILVLKYRYLFEDPNRWDVVVFKSPYEGTRDPEDPKIS